MQDKHKHTVHTSIIFGMSTQQQVEHYDYAKNIDLSTKKRKLHQTEEFRGTSIFFNFDWDGCQRLNLVIPATFNSKKKAPRKLFLYLDPCWN